MDSNRTQGWVRHQPCVRNYRYTSSSINSDCGHWIVFYRARNLHSARRKKQKRIGFACQPRAVPRSCLFIIIWANTTHDTQVRAAWPLCTSVTFGHTRRLHYKLPQRRIFWQSLSTKHQTKSPTHQEMMTRYTCNWLFAWLSTEVVYVVLRVVLYAHPGVRV